MRLLSISLFAALSLLLPAALPAAPQISEFQAENTDTARDEDGDTSDWLEVFNPDATAVNLAGMSLTDDPLVPKKWVFPSVQVPASGFVLVWCSGKNRTDGAAPLHANFKLEKTGGYLGFYAADGTTKLSEWNPYPEQFADRSWGSARVVVTQTLLAAGAACRWRVPTAAITGWETPAFVDTAWTAATTGIGYDTNFTTDYRPLFGTSGTVPTGTTTCYVRIPFALTAASTVQTMTLRMKFDDGFAAFLNGTRLNPPTAAQTNAPAALAFNSIASATHADSESIVFQTYDLTTQRSLLVNGTNVLAIQMLNAGASSSDFLMVPELSVTKLDAGSSGTTGYFAVPTPGTANSVAPVTGFVDAPDFSVKRGFFSSPVSVTLTTKTPGAQIRYTTNGAAPTATTGTIYVTPLTISTSTVLRAGAFVPGWQPSAVKSHTYIFPALVVNQPAAPAGFPTQWGNEYDFTTGTLTGPAVPADYRMDPGITTNAAYSALMVPALTTTLPVLSISGDVNQIFNSTSGIYGNQRIVPGLEIRASIEFWNPSSPAENWQENIGLRMHGGDAPIEHPKKPFRVYFRKEYGADRLRQPLFPGSSVESFDKLQLRPGGHDGWAVPFGSGAESLARHATYIRDRYLRQTELDMGRLSHRGRYVHLYINGLYWGFYDIHEVQSKEFFADHMGGLDDDWDVVEHTNVANPLFDVVDGSGDAMAAALALVRPATNAALPSTWDALAEYVDYDEMIDHLFVQMWGGQNDWMGPVFRGVPGVNLTDASRFFNKNWQAGRRSRGPDPTGFLWQVWDAEISMGNSLTSLVSTMRVTDFNHTLIGTPTTDFAHVAGTPGPIAEIFYAMRKYNPRFRMKVADRLRHQFFNGGAMTVGNNLARLQRFRDELDLPIVPESARWGDVNSGDPVVVAFNRNDHWRSEMDWMRDTYVPGRNDTLLSQFAAIGLWPATKAPDFAPHGGVVPAGFQLPVTDPNTPGGTIYYTLDGSDPMGVPETLSVTLADSNSPCSYKVPAAQYPTNSWKARTPPADIATWNTGTAALGFDANPTFGPHITTPLTGMQNVNSTLYVRIPFSVTPEQKATLTSLTLRLKYDDGAYVFLNGSTPLFRLNSASLASPSYQDRALALRADADAINWQTFDLSAYIPGLVTDGPNVLAIQGLNLSVSDEDFLCAAELVATATPAPQPSASARAYTGDVPLPRSGVVKARVLKDGVWSPLTEASYIVGVPASAANLTISEFSYNPVASPDELNAGLTDQQFEFMELMNISADVIELTGTRFDDGISFDFPAGTLMAPGSRLVLAASQAAFAVRHPGISVFGEFANLSNLSNNGERIEFLDHNGEAIFDFVYDDQAPWPVSPDGGGFSLVLIDPVSDPDPAIAANWRASFVPGGSPGSADADNFDAWALRNSIIGGPGGDANGNGLTNLTEYGLGLNPATSGPGGLLSAGFETLTIGGTPDTWLVIRYRRNVTAEDVTVTPEMSTDLITWTPMTDDASPPVSNPGGTEDIARRSPQPVAAGARVYVRVSVTKH